MIISEALKRIRYESDIRGMEISEQEKLMILSDATGRSFSYILSNKDISLTEEQIKRLLNFIQEIFVNSKPIEKLVKRSYFFGLELYVDENVLSPRHDTEILVERVLEYIDLNGLLRPRILDMGAGSACISLAIASNCCIGNIIASDISKGSLKVAEKNIKKYLMDNKIQTRESDLFANINEDDFDIIVTNPPYVSEAEMMSLEEKITRYDPTIALYGGKDGLDFYYAFFKEAHRHIKRGGAVFCETGSRQAGKVMDLMKGNYIDIAVFKDYGGNDRVVFGKPV